MDFQELKTPCFIIQDNLLKANFNDFQNALSKYFPKNICSYSVKTNSLPYILKTALENNWYLEVVSTDEYNLAKKVGAKPEKIIYNGPAKDKETFYEAVLGGAYVNIETKRELEWLKGIKASDNINIGLRLNINFERLNGNTIDGTSSRFGFSFENKEFEKALNKLQTMGFKKIGIHTHRSSKTRSLNTYKNICLYALDILNKLNINLSYFDVGGGFYGLMPNKPDYMEYSKAIFEVLSKGIDINTIPIIIEPGNAIVASAIDYMFSIIDIKEIDNQIICVSDGSRTDTDPFFHKEDYIYKIYSTQKECKTDKPQIITGNTCLEKDIIAQLKDNRKLNIEDKVLFKWQGAYTMTLSPNFITLQSNVYKKEQENYIMVRKKWTAEEWVQNSFWE